MRSDKKYNTYKEEMRYKMRELELNNEKHVTKQLTLEDQQLIAEYHFLSERDQKLIKAYMQGFVKMASISENSGR